jgi:hypothetical protein
MKTGRFPVTRTIIIAVIWLAIRAILAYVFRDNPGGYVENHFREHNIWLLTKFPMAMRYTLAVIILFFVFLRVDWREKPKFLRAGLAIVLLPLAGAGMFFGFADELRGYYEAYPFLYLLMIPTVFKFLSKASARED